MPSTDPDQAEPGPAGASPSLIVALVAIIAVATALRIGAAQGDLWVDEIWSLDQLAVARAADSAEVWLALLFHDNTHALNTLYLAAIDALWTEPPPALAYRGLALVSGSAAVVVAAALGWHKSPLGALVAALMVGLSYPMVHYAGEARGYGPMLLAALLACWLMSHHLQRPGAWTGVAFVAVSLLGLAAHLTFAVAEAGLAAWAAWAFHRQRPGTAATMARLVPLFGLQLIAVTAYATVAVNALVIGGDNFEPAAASIAIITLYTFGLAPTWLGPYLTLFMFGFLAAAAVIWLAWRDVASWPVFAVIVLACPVAALLVEDRPYVLPRYFLVCLPFALMLAAEALTELMERGGLARRLAAAALIAFAAGNAGLLTNFLHHGRGDYAAAVALIAEAGPDHARVAGFPPFSVGTMFRHHARRHPAAKRLSFVDDTAARQRPADWFIAARGAGRAPAAELIRQGGGAYGLVRSFAHWGLAGDTWDVYRRRR